ncbi:MAG TPA: DUF2269 family protein [Candidatus Cybelea sp.]
MTTTVYFFHVLFAFAAIAFLVVPGAMMEMAAHTRDVPFIRRMYQMGKFHGQIGGPLALLAALVGLFAAWRLGIPWTSGWLVAAYVVFALIMLLGIGYHTRREIRIGALAQASPDAAPSPELAAVIDDPLSRPVLWASGLLWILLIWLMVAKPF